MSPRGDRIGDHEDLFRMDLTFARRMRSSTPGASAACFDPDFSAQPIVGRLSQQFPMDWRQLPSGVFVSDRPNPKLSISNLLLR